MQSITSGIGAALGAVGWLAAAALGVMLFFAERREHAAEMKVADQQRAAVAGQNVELQGAAVNAGRRADVQADVGIIANGAGAQVASEDQAADAALAKGKNDATHIGDDRPAGLKLVFAANSLRVIADEILSAGDDREAGVPALRDPGRGVGEPAPAGVAWPRLESEFGDYALDWGRFAKQCTARLKAARGARDAFNARIDMENARRPP